MTGVNDGGAGDREVIPPIEIGSFIALRPDESEFIGSASGIFFTNTVFQAFATATSPNAALLDNDAVTPDPASSHTLFIAAENETTQELDNETRQDRNASRLNENQESRANDSPSYGMTEAGLGVPPPPEIAKDLLMLYFRNWHPFFPFLHGPTFLDQVNSFYETDWGADTNIPRLDQRRRICQAVTFQCIFNVAASGQTGRHRLRTSCRIQSTSTLTNLIGVLSSSSDIASLQGLLAAALYLMTQLSLRAASTIIGVLTQALYQSGLHRCPHRYVQLPSEMRLIRQRIFWCAYVLDRQLSQALGHPPAMKDNEIDVCYPGMNELHSSVRASGEGPQTQTCRASVVRDHLPRSPAGRSQSEDDSGTPFRGPTSKGSLGFQSPAHHYKTSTEEVGEYVLGYLVTYFKLVDSAMNLFHQSIHRRNITRDTVTDLTAQMHSWWNSLPLSLQQDSQSGSQSRFSAFFTIAYHYLLVVTNRPFLSLPTHRTDFKSSLQTALTASRAIVQVLKTTQDNDMLFNWPGAFAAAWMSGLIIAFSSLLRAYPLEKAASEIATCIAILDNMGSKWSSARRCRMTLATFLGKLEKGYRARQQVPDGPSTNSLDRDTLMDSSDPGRMGSPSPRSDTTPRNKRRRTHSHLEPSPQCQPQTRSSHSDMVSDPMDYHLWQPVLQYRGPDFGFDSSQMAPQGEWLGLLNNNIPSESAGLYDLSGWDAYMQSWGNNFNF
ncbi:fungal specific transcription factor domain-containing protein [Sarocladium implicatum]|nr:fungal specific transcription factor domain-containing protein [Sarocladium implicatum]